MGKMAQKREQKRQAILRAAQDVFLSQGFLGANMDDIADRAQVTKQTVYRYYPSKIDLFQATLQFIGERSDARFTDHLDEPDTAVALHKFAVGFIRAHLSEEFLSTFRLLVAESGSAPDMVAAFFEVAPDDTERKLEAFFQGRLGIEDSTEPVRLWTAMLLAFRDDALLGRACPTDGEIEAHAKTASKYLLAGLSVP